MWLVYVWLPHNVTEFVANGVPLLFASKLHVHGHQKQNRSDAYFLSHIPLIVTYMLSFPSLGNYFRVEYDYDKHPLHLKKSQAAENMSNTQCL